MKVSVTVLCFIAFSCYSISLAEAAAGRQKRSASKEMCPENTTYEQCVEYAKEKSKTLKYCHHHFVGGKNWIEWQTCGSVSCGENTVLVAEDLSKSYPDCCEHCEVVDVSKPATISDVA